MSSCEVLDSEDYQPISYEWFDRAITAETREYFAWIVEFAQAENAQLPDGL